MNAIDHGVRVCPDYPLHFDKEQNKLRQRNSMAHIQIHEGESIENALRRFKRKVLQEDIIKEAKKHAFYLKPGEKKRIKQALARKRSRKKIRRQPTEDR
jgi:small subunit ribosomal protein S21